MDLTLIRRSQAGDEEAFAALFQKYKNLVYKTAYLMLGSVSGTSPGTVLPGGVTLPLNWDVFTNLVLDLANTPLFPDFLGTLDGAGRGNAQIFTAPLPPSSAGTTMYFAYALNKPWDFASNAVMVGIVP